ncbi:MAG: hypothetical protein ACT4PE_00385 [Candidatus Eiseniibacteriota bacterium]
MVHGDATIRIGDSPEPRRSIEREETRMRTLAWTGYLFLSFLDLFWWMR